MEDSASLAYCHYLEEVGVRSDKDYFGFPVLNIKVVKIVFNRAYRMTSTDPMQACKIYESLIAALDDLMPSKPDSYYRAKMYLEIAKTYANRHL